MTAVDALYKSEVVRGVLCIVDLNEPGRRSVTNDAEAIILRLHALGVLPRGRRVIYRDSMGIWDEILVLEGGRLRGFAPLQAHTLEQALEQLRKDEP